MGDFSIEVAPFRRPPRDTICFTSLTLRLGETQSHTVRQVRKMRIPYLIEIQQVHLCLWKSLEWSFSCINEDATFP